MVYSTASLLRFQGRALVQTRTEETIEAGAVGEGVLVRVVLEAAREAEVVRLYDTAVASNSTDVV